MLYAIAPIMVVVSGVMYLVSGASPDLRSKAKSALTSTIIGILISVCGFAIIGTALWIFGNGEAEGGAKVGWPNIECKVFAPGDYDSPFVPGGADPNFKPAGGSFGGGGATGNR